MNSNKIITVFVGMLAMILLVASASAAVEISVDSTTVNQSDTTTINITAHNINNLGQFAIKLEYDTSIVGVIEVHNNPTIPDTQGFSDTTDDGSLSLVSSSSVLPSLSGAEVNLATLTLKAKGNPGDESPLNITIGLLISNVQTNILATDVDGIFKIRSNDQSPASIVISGSPTTTLTAGDNHLFTATVRDQNNDLMDGIKLTWTSSNTSVGELDSIETITVSGSATSTFTAHNAGTTFVNATNGSFKGSVFVIVNASNKPPVADPNGPYTGTEGIAVSFDGTASSDPDGTIVSYSWDFGDSTLFDSFILSISELIFGDSGTGTGATPSHIYAQNGTYTITLTVTDNDGTSSPIATTTATISDTHPVSNFTGTPPGGPEPLTVTFTNTSTSYDGLVSWSWNFGDGNTTTVANPTHQYTSEGTYTVSLTVCENDGDCDTETKVNYITVSNVNLPPVANPNGPYTGTEGIAVSFDGTASSDPDGTVNTYSWNFGDSGTGTGATPSHVYAQNGTYTVTLTVTDNDGTSSPIATTTATISDTHPVSNFTGTPPGGPEPLTVTFTNTSTSYDGLVSWSWNFGDGNTATIANPTHQYTSEGTYTVSLTVCENDGDCDTETKVNYITVSNVNLPPVANPNGPYTGSEGIAVSFDGTASSDPDGTVNTYSWNFGDSGTGTGATPSHIYAQNGTYTVTLTVTDNDGTSSPIATTTATISDIDPVADFTGTPPGGPEPLTVTFTNTSTSYDGLVSWLWDFGDGNTATIANPTHQYTSEGTYTVSLTVCENDGDCDTETKVNYITVSNVNLPPVADPNGPYTGTEGIAVSFDGTASSDPDGTVNTYSWNFGDSGTGTGAIPSHIYAQNGTYTVTLIVTDNDGTSSPIATTTATISDTHPVSNFTGTPPGGPEPLTVTFTNTSTSYDGLVSWSWNFGDGNSGTGANPTHQYTSEGTYTVSLTVCENDGDCDTETKVNYITVSNVIVDLPVADPNGPYSGIVGIPINFTGSASGGTPPYTSYLWEFGDGTTSNDQNPAHSYASNGTYTANLTVTDTASNSAMGSTQVEIRIKGDIDGDGEITTTDALIYLKYSLDNTKNPYHLSNSDDVTCDGTVDIDDALAVLKKSVNENFNLDSLCTAVG